MSAGELVLFQKIFSRRGAELAEKILNEKRQLFADTIGSYPGFNTALNEGVGAVFNRDLILSRRAQSSQRCKSLS